MKKSVDLDALSASMTEDEVLLTGVTLVWKHGGDLAVTIAEMSDDQVYEVDMSVLTRQTGRKKPLSREEENLFRKCVTDYFTGMGRRVVFGGEVDFFEKTRKSDIIG